MTQLSPQTITKIHTYIDEGVPLEDLFSGNAGRANIERVKVAEQVYERFCQDPMLDINRCLLRTFGRTKQQAILDKQVIDLFVDSMEGVGRKLMTARASKIAERLIRVGEQMGDPKWMDKGLTQYIRLHRLDEEEADQDSVKNTAMLPPILVDINVVNPEKHAISDEHFKQLIQKYGGKEDDFDKLIELHARRMSGEDVSVEMIMENDEEGL